MREYIYIVIFLVGLASTIWSRVSFEKQQKATPKDKRYASLYREHNTLLIIIFAALVVDKVVALLGQGS